MLLNILVISFCSAIANAEYYDSYTGLPVTDDQLAVFEKAQITGTCTNYVEPCDPDEWRRVDGTCNNLDYPSRGAFHTPQYRLLEPVFNTENGGFQPRLTESGEQLELARKLRLELLTVGVATDDVFTQSVPFFIEFVFGDIGSTHDTLNNVFTTPYCCEERGKTEYMCTPNIISDDDFVHRFSDVRCMNLTRPISFQSVGCLANDTTPVKMDFTTTSFDLSMIYDYKDNIISRIRSNSSGMLKTETLDGNPFPSAANATTTCLIEDAIETGCTRDVPTGLLGTMLFTTWFWRYHNLIAKQLEEINPCWDNDMLFFTAREINIAVYLQILYYEFLPLLFGEENLIKENIISSDTGCRETYDATIPPQTILEASYIMRWFHTIQDSKLKLYDKNDNFVNTTTVVNFILNVETLAANDSLSLITHGIYRQPCGKFDHNVDPDIADKGLGSFQKAFDITTADLAKGRYNGFQPYIKYREYFTNKTYTCFEDLKDVISEENLYVLMNRYKSVNDVELMAGTWCENKLNGANVPPTVANIMMAEMKRNVQSDRHWYERCDRPHAMTDEQLKEIRKMSLARFLCDVGDDVTRIQPDAFLLIDDDNCVVSCDEIPNMDLSAWKD